MLLFLGFYFGNFNDDIFLQTFTEFKANNSNFLWMSLLKPTPPLLFVEEIDLTLTQQEGREGLPWWPSG